MCVRVRVCAHMCMVVCLESEEGWGGGGGRAGGRWTHCNDWDKVGVELVDVLFSLYQWDGFSGGL